MAASTNPVVPEVLVCEKDTAERIGACRQRHSVSHLVLFERERANRAAARSSRSSLGFSDTRLQRARFRSPLLTVHFFVVLSQTNKNILKYIYLEIYILPLARSRRARFADGRQERVDGVHACRGNSSSTSPVSKASPDNNNAPVRFGAPPSTLSSSEREKKDAHTPASRGGPQSASRSRGATSFAACGPRVTLGHAFLRISFSRGSSPWHVSHAP